MKWKVLETTITAESEKAIAKWIRQNPKHHAYAVAFHAYYRELDAQIAFPLLAVNSVEALLRQQRSKDGIELEWNPADWRWSNILPDRSQLQTLEAELFEEANRSTQAHWYRTEKHFLAVMVRVVKALQRKFTGHEQATDDFIAYFDDEGNLDLIRRCVPSKLFKKHFGRFVDPAAAIKSPKERTRRYFEDIYTYRKQIQALGEVAVVPLVEKLRGKEDGWCAASLLGDLGIRRNTVIKALRERTSANTSVAHHSARSLFLLGDVDFLFSLVQDAKTRVTAVTGILTGLMARASDCPHRIPLDYRPAEQLLKIKSVAVSRLVHEELQAGRSFIDIKTTDVDEALRGLNSPHAVIRRHAVFVLGKRGLGNVVAKVALPALAERLHDKEPSVRRMALFALSYWKAAAQPYHEEMRKLQKDKNAEVCSSARYVFDKVE